MKKLLLTTALVAIFGFAATAQEQGDFRIGAGLAAGTKAAFDEEGTKLGLGINFGAEYLITDAISIAPSYTLYFKSEVDLGGFGTIESSPKALNIDVRYYFGESGVYGLAGFTNVGDEEKESGLNIGAGIMYPLSDNFFLNGQAKYQTPGEGQLVFNAGVAIGF